MLVGIGLREPVAQFVVTIAGNLAQRIGHRDQPAYRIVAELRDFSRLVGLGGLAALQVFAVFLRVFAMLAFGGLGGLMAVSTRARRVNYPDFPKELCQKVGNVPFLAMFLYVADQAATAMSL